ncbi:MAG: hypothetical protein O3A00_04105, partial [Planctomycetota bacterium]|nr:hypothetical protein [Planctomycetota bacterium]
GGGTFSEFTISMTGANSGTVDVTGNSQLTFSALEGAITSTLATTNSTVNFTTTSETIEINPLGVVGNQTQITSTFSQDVVIASPTGNLTVNAGTTNADTIIVDGVAAGFSGTLAANGQGGGDIVQVVRELALQGASISLTGQLLDINKSISATSGSISLIATQQIDRRLAI